jgi:hypothetical protein
MDTISVVPDGDQQALSVPDLTGEPYVEVLRRFHKELQPKSYFEIGTLFGDSLAFVECPAIAVDPDLSKLRAGFIGRKEICALFQMPSDRFFETHDPKIILGRPIEMAFLDGMHRCEYLLRDFANVERHCKPNSVIFLHDCVPVETPIVERINKMESIESHRKGWWLGDVWRTLLALKRRRPDLQISVLDAYPSGLACITNLDPKNTTLFAEYAQIRAEMLTWSLADIGLSEYLASLDIQSTSAFDTSEKITRRFWL